MAVYLIQAGAEGLVKIGSTKDIHRRLAMLQVGSAAHLRLLHLFDGGTRAEHDLHRKFAASRVRGEWFEPCAEIIAGNVDLPSLPFEAPVRKKKPSAEPTSAPREKKPSRWTDPVWAAERRAKCRENGPRLSLLYSKREVAHFLAAAERCRLDGREDGALWCERQAQPHLLKIAAAEVTI